MKIQRLKRIQTASADLEAVQRNVSDAVDQVGECPLIRGQEFSGALLAAGAVELQHKLGRVPAGWLLTDVVSAGAPIITRVAWSSRTITLATSADAAIRGWVF